MGGGGHTVELTFSSPTSLQGQPGFSTSIESPYPLLSGTGVIRPSQRSYWLVLEKTDKSSL